MKKILFYASRPHFLDHLWPIYKEFELAESNDYEARLYLTQPLEHYGERSTPLRLSLDINYGDVAVVSSSADAMTCRKTAPSRPIIMMEHGVGITFPKNQSYAGFTGIRAKVAMFLAPNQWIHDKTWVVLPKKPQAIVGTPKMDKWKDPPKGNKCRICISFHWNGSAVAPEAGNALEYYVKHLSDYAKAVNRIGYELVGHCHPRIVQEVKPHYKDAGIPFIDNFDEVMETCLLYINDCSSTLYEAATIMPVIILNAPWFRRDIDFGIRFWKWTDIGFQCNHPDDLISLIDMQLHKDPNVHTVERLKMRRDLYPFMGESSQVAANAIKKFALDNEIL